MEKLLQAGCYLGCVPRLRWTRTIDGAFSVSPLWCFRTAAAMKV